VIQQKNNAFTERKLSQIGKLNPKQQVETMPWKKKKSSVYVLQQSNEKLEIQRE